MAIAVIFASGKGTRLAKATGGAPKHLLEIDPGNKDALRRTVVGRLVSQFLGRREIEKVVVICTREKDFAEYFARFPSLSGKVQLKAIPQAYDWKQNFRALSEVVGRKPFVAVAGDIVLHPSTISRAIAATKTGKQLTHFISAVKGRPFYKPKVSGAAWASKGGLPEWVFSYNAERWSELPKVLLRHGGSVSVKATVGFANVNRPTDIERAKRLIRKRKL